MNNNWVFHTLKENELIRRDTPKNSDWIFIAQKNVKKRFKLDIQDYLYNMWLAQRLQDEWSEQRKIKKEITVKRLFGLTHFHNLDRDISLYVNEFSTEKGSI